MPRKAGRGKVVDEALKDFTSIKGKPYKYTLIEHDGKNYYVAVYKKGDTYRGHLFPDEKTMKSEIAKSKRGYKFEGIIGKKIPITEDLLDKKSENMIGYLKSQIPKQLQIAQDTETVKRLSEVKKPEDIAPQEAVPEDVPEAVPLPKEEKEVKITQEDVSALSRTLLNQEDAIVAIDAKSKKYAQKMLERQQSLEEVVKALPDKFFSLVKKPDLKLTYGVNKLMITDGKLVDKQIAEIVDDYDSLKDITDENERNEKIKQIVKKVNSLYVKKEKARIANPKALIRSIRKLKI